MKNILPFLIITAALAGGAFLLTRGGEISEPGTVENVVVSNGVQIVDISARGGYTPRRSTAKADMPTILRVSTSGTFDCSSAIRIPSLDVAKNLPYTGTTDIPLGSPAAGLLRGSCAMGMYPFEIDFQP